MTDIKFTRTHQKYFEQFAPDMFELALSQAGVDKETSDKILSLIDVKEYATRLGTAVLTNCSFADIKRLDKHSRDPAIIRATLAIEDAMAATAPSLDATKNIAFAASMMTSGIHKGDNFMDALADADEAVQEAVIQQLTQKV